MTLGSEKWRRPAMVFAVVGLLALAGYFLATNQQVREAFAASALAGNGASQSAGHGQDETGAESAHAGHAHGGDEPTVATTLWANQVDI
jgi:Tfp pilus assembly protein PilV